MQEIVILTPYLGQLRTIMVHMREQDIAEMADRRDEEELERQGMELEVRFMNHEVHFSAQRGESTVPSSMDRWNFFGDGTNRKPTFSFASLFCWWGQGTANFCWLFVR